LMPRSNKLKLHLCGLHDLLKYGRERVQVLVGSNPMTIEMVFAASLLSMQY
jgi:hypothetical protein